MLLIVICFADTKGSCVWVTECVVQSLPRMLLRLCGVMQGQQASASVDYFQEDSRWEFLSI